MKSTLIFDIETIGQDESRLLAIAPEFKPAANLKDPEKIKASIEEKRQSYLEKAALDWKTAEVVLVGFFDGFEYRSIYSQHEKEVIQLSLDVIGESLDSGAYVGGHNVKDFDLPMLVNRARVHGLKLPGRLLEYFRGRATWDDHIFDTLEMFGFGDISGNGVDAIARALGIQGKLGSGADFPNLWRTNQAAAIEYNKRDCEVEFELARFCGF